MIETPDKHIEWASILAHLAEDRASLVEGITNPGRIARSVSRLSGAGTIGIKMGTRVQVNKDRDIWITVEKTVQVSGDGSIEDWESSHIDLLQDVGDMLDEALAVQIDTSLASTINRVRQNRDVISLNKLLKGLSNDRDI